MSWRALRIWKAQLLLILMVDPSHLGICIIPSLQKPQPSVCKAQMWSFVQNARSHTHVTACTLPLNILINRNKLSYCYLPLLLLKLPPPCYFSSLRLFMERRISFNFIDEEVDRASSSGRARYELRMSDSNLRPRLLALIGPNYPTLFQPIERKSPSLCLGSKALPTSHAPF